MKEVIVEKRLSDAIEILKDARLRIKDQGQDFVVFISSRLQRKSGIGRLINIMSLRKKNTSNTLSTKDDCELWPAFEEQIASTGIGNYLSPTHYHNWTDHLGSMFKVLGGQVHVALNLQVSIIDNSFEQKKSQDKNSFLRKLSRRQVL